MDNKNSLEDMITNSAYFVNKIESSFNKNIDRNSYIFRRGMNWYQFENWDLPNSGLIREWSSITKTCIPSKEYTKDYNKTNSNIIFDLKSFNKKFKSYKVRHITFSTDTAFILILLERVGIYDLVVVDKCSNIISTTKNISIESLFFMNNGYLLFCRDDDYGRPSKLFQKNIENGEELLIYEEPNLAYRLKLIPTGSSNDTCFVKSSDFTSGTVFLVMILDEGLKYFKLPNSAIGIFDLLEVNQKKFLITLLTRGTNQHHSTLNVLDLENKKSFELRTKRIVKKLVCVGSHILLDTSKPFEYVYTLMKKVEGEVLSFKEINIKFSQKATLYENSFDDNVILFSEKNAFSETIFSYDINSEKLKKEFSKSFIKQNSNESYHYKLIWTKGKNGKKTKIPISILWKGESEKLPNNYPCVSYVYGSYGKNDNIEFDPLILSIVDSGFLYAVIHVRGGGFLGGDWYRDGKAMNKKNSIQDYINGIKFLINEGIIHENKIGLISSSAGGIIAGAVLNEEKNLLKSILLFSPFINLYKQLIYGNDPLTKTEISEWGDISNEKTRKYIISYSPLQNIKKAQGSNTTVLSILGKTDKYIDNDDVIDWSSKLQKLGVKSYVYMNPKAGHGGINSEDQRLLINILSFFLKNVME